jgi:hypothetical protein
VAVSVQDMADATVETLLRRVKEDTTEENTYIGISLTHLQQDEITHLAASYINRTPILFTRAGLDKSNLIRLSL